MEAAKSLERNPTAAAEISRACCLYRAGEIKQAEVMYQDMKRRNVHSFGRSYLAYRELVGPLEKLQEDSRDYLLKNAGDFPSEIARLRAEYCAKPSGERENKLRELQPTRPMALSTVVRVALLQSEGGTGGFA